jgi:hypothetical protein
LAAIKHGNFKASHHSSHRKQLAYQQGTSNGSRARAQESAGRKLADSGESGRVNLD